MEELKNKIPQPIYSTLIKSNITSLDCILTSNKNELIQLTNLDQNIIEKLIEVAANILIENKLKKANNYLKWQRISTGCVSIDTIIQGGIPFNGITEIVGCGGVGKTQLCLQLSLMTQLPTSLGGVERAAVYICADSVFPSKRLNELSKVYYFKYKDFVKTNFEDSIFLEHVADFEQLRRCLCVRLPKLLKVKNVGLIVIDSIAGPFRSENINVNYANRSQEFVLIATRLNKLSTKYNLAVVCVNQVVDNIENGRTEPCLGLAWSNLVTRRFNIHRCQETQTREFKIIFAPDLPDIKCRFKITKEGLIGIE